MLLTYVNMSELSCENYTEKKASGWNVVYICITIRLQPEHNLAAFVLHTVWKLATQCHRIYTIQYTPHSKLGHFSSAIHCKKKLTREWKVFKFSYNVVQECIDYDEFAATVKLAL